MGGCSGLEDFVAEGFVGVGGVVGPDVGFENFAEFVDAADFVDSENFVDSDSDSR